MSELEKKSLKEEQQTAILELSALLIDLADEDDPDTINYPAKISSASHALNVLIRTYFEQ